MNEWLALAICVGAFALGMLLGWAIEDWFDKDLML
jgi:hypothetical protein